MIFNLFFFILFYFFVSLSVLGFGFLLTSIRKLNFSDSLGYKGLAGILFVSLYSYLTSLFIPHSEIHNLIFLLIGLIFLFFQLKKNILKKNKEIKFFFFLKILFFLGICIFKTHDDFYYYHFQFSYILTQYKIPFGIGSFDLGYRTPSSLFYINSLFYLPIINFYSFHFTVLIIFLFSNLILLREIADKFKKREFNFLSFYSLISLIFIITFFPRFGEHGTDLSAQILIFLLFLEIFKIILNEIKIKEQLSKVLLLISLIIGFKAFYVLYFIFIFFIVIVIIKIKDFKILKTCFFKNFYFYFFLIKANLIFFHSFINTGCLIYPVTFLCFENFVWSIKINEVNELNNWYQLWSKGGATPNYRVENPEVFIKNLNWVGTWIKVYFFNKISDFLLGITFLALIFLLIFYPFKKKKIRKKNFFFTILITILLLLLLEWFLNHPALRYGGYSLIAVLIFVFLCRFYERSSLKKNQLKNRFIFLIILSLVIFNLRNLHRIYKENKKYGYNVFRSVYFDFKENHLNFHKHYRFLINNYELCLEDISNKDCKINTSPSVNKIFGYYVFYNK